MDQKEVPKKLDQREVDASQNEAIGNWIVTIARLTSRNLGTSSILSSQVIRRLNIDLSRNNFDRSLQDYFSAAHCIKPTASELDDIIQSGNFLPSSHSKVQMANTSSTGKSLTDALEWAFSFAPSEKVPTCDLSKASRDDYVQHMNEKRGFHCCSTKEDSCASENRKGFFTNATLRSPKEFHLLVSDHATGMAGLECRDTFYLVGAKSLRPELPNGDPNDMFLGLICKEEISSNFPATLKIATFGITTEKISMWGAGYKKGKIQYGTRSMSESVALFISRSLLVPTADGIDLIYVGTKEEFDGFAMDKMLLSDMEELFAAARLREEGMVIGGKEVRGRRRVLGAEWMENDDQRYEFFAKLCRSFSFLTETFQEPNRNNPMFQEVIRTFPPADASARAGWVEPDPLIVSEVDLNFNSAWGFISGLQFAMYFDVGGNLDTPIFVETSKMVHYGP